MKQLILIFTFLISGMVFSKSGEIQLTNDIRSYDQIIVQSNIEEINKFMSQNETVYIHNYDDFPCTLSATVTGKVVIDGSVITVTLSGSLELDDCFDIGSVGVSFLRGLVNEVISELTNRMR